jgi:hypothetical protein
MTNKNELFDKMGVTEDEVQQHDELKDRPANLQLSMLFDDEKEFNVDHVDVVIEDDEPTLVEVEYGDGTEAEVPTFRVSNDDVPFTLWVSAKSFRKSFASALASDAEAVRITQREYEHEQYGTTVAYDCESIPVSDVEPLPDVYLDSHR